jgi:hypothetical protein
MFYSLDKPSHHRLEFLNYSLSLMRSLHEHGDQEPSLDVLAYKHLVYLFDGFIYYFRENSLNRHAPVNRVMSTHSKDTHDQHQSTLTKTSNQLFVGRCIVLNHCLQMKPTLSLPRMFSFNVRLRHYV